VPGEAGQGGDKDGGTGVYSYIDEQGSLHIVSSLDAIPEQSRASSTEVPEVAAAFSIGAIHLPSLAFGFALALVLGVAAQLSRGAIRLVLNVLGAGVLALLLVGAYGAMARNRAASPVPVSKAQPSAASDEEAPTKPNRTASRASRKPSQRSNATKRKVEKGKKGSDLLIIGGDDL
jgi:uncharacterized membrane protein (Fun14 family)